MARRSEFPTSTYAFTYSTAVWDNRTAFLDPKTKSIVGDLLPSSLVLLTNAHEIALHKRVASHGGHMVTNGAPWTRSWIDYSVHAQSPPIAENENSNAWRALHVQLFTPLMLNRCELR